MDISVANRSAVFCKPALIRLLYNAKCNRLHLERKGYLLLVLLNSMIYLPRDPTGYYTYRQLQGGFIT